MKQSMRYLCPVFNTNRMVYEYTTRMYQPAVERGTLMADDGMARAKSLAAWKKKIRENWKNIKTVRVVPNMPETLKVGNRLEVEAYVELGILGMEDVLVQLYYGPINPDGGIGRGRTITMTFDRTDEDGISVFKGSCPCRASGLHGYALRILPRHGDMGNSFETRLIHWSD
jgi:starch phosphorylase